MALRLPDPVRFDAYCFLKGLADAADMFPLVPPQEGSGTAQGSSTSVEDEDPLEFHRREQEALSEKFESGALRSRVGSLVILWSIVFTCKAAFKVKERREILRIGRRFAYPMIT